MENKKTQNDMMACIEAVACVGIVFLHCSGYSGLPGDIVNLGSRFAVPFFYMVSGFYLFRPEAELEEKKQRLKRKARRIFWMVLISSLLYIAYLFVGRRLLEHASFKGMLMEYFDFREVLMWLLFNNVPFATHLWFVYALLYVYLLLYGMTYSKKIFQRCLQSDILPFSLAATGIVLRFFAFFSTKQIWYFSIADLIFYRNWIFTAFPFVLMGYCLRRNVSKIQKFTTHSMMILAVAGIFLTVCEWRLYTYLFSTYPDLYFGTIVLTLALFALAILHPECGRGSWLAKFGREMAMPIYVIHVMMLRILRNIFAIMGGDAQAPWYAWGKPFFVLILSVGGAALFLFGRKIGRQCVRR